MLKHNEVGTAEYLFRSKLSQDYRENQYTVLYYTVSVSVYMINYSINDNSSTNPIWSVDEMGTVVWTGQER